MTGPRFESINPLRLSRSKIIRIAEDISRSYANLHGDTPSIFFTINYEHVYDTLLYPQYELSLEEDSDLGEDCGEKILGFYDVFSNTIALDKVFNDRSNLLSSKKAFTFWHELGHAVLHGEWMKTQIANFPDGRIVSVESAISLNNSTRLEKQANLFAAHCAVPKWFLDDVLRSTFQLTRPIRYVGPNTYWLEIWGVRKLCKVDSFQELCRSIAYSIRYRFVGLSIEALTYRVQSSRWMSNEPDDVVTPFRLLRTTPTKVGAVMAAAL